MTRILAEVEKSRGWLAMRRAELEMTRIWQRLKGVVVWQRLADQEKGRA